MLPAQPARDGGERERPRRWRWVVPGALVLGLAACSSGSDLALVGTPSPDPLTAPATAPTGTPGVIVVTPQPARLVTGPPAQHPTSLPWTAQVISADGRHVTIGYTSSGCTGVIGVQVVQTSTSVQLTVWGATGGGFACTMQRVDASVVVTLDPPLGHRALLHAPVSRRWAQTPS